MGAVLLTFQACDPFPSWSLPRATGGWSPRTTPHTFLSLPKCPRPWKSLSKTRKNQFHVGGNNVGTRTDSLDSRKKTLGRDRGRRFLGFTVVDRGRGRPRQGARRTRPRRPRRHRPRKRLLSRFFFFSSPFFLSSSSLFPLLAPRKKNLFLLRELPEIEAANNRFCDRK